MSGNRIRSFEEGDLDALERIERASYPSAWSRDVLASWIARSNASCHVVVHDTLVVGFVVVGFEPDALHLVNLAIDRDHRRRGLALALLGRVDDLAEERGAERIVLEVRETNLPAQLLYSSAGYRAVGIVPGYYAGEDAYRMIKRRGGRHA